MGKDEMNNQKPENLLMLRSLERGTLCVVGLGMDALGAQ